MTEYTETTQNSNGTDVDTGINELLAYIRIERYSNDALHLVDVRTGQQLSIELHRTVKAMLQASFVRIASVNNFDFVRNRPISASDWVFITDTENQRFSQLRNRKSKRIGCVYFATSPAVPDYVKIGQTQDLILRAKTHERDLEAPLYIFAYGKTPYHVEHERAIHDWIKAQGVPSQGEWFHRDVTGMLGDIFAAGYAK
jgi:hypothetical protein